MKTLSFMLLIAVAGANGTSYAHDVRGCIASNTNCPSLPPMPPMPPMPPVPPMPPEATALALPPMPPAPPPPPTVPAAAHKACAGKAPGSAMTWVLEKGTTMGGTCEQGATGMRFSMRSVWSDNQP